MASRLLVRLAATTFVVALLGGLFGGWVVQRSTKSAVRGQAEELTVGLAERLAREIDQSITGLATSLRVLATREDISARSGRSEVELAVALRAFEDVDELVIHDAEGGIVAAVAENRVVNAQPLGVTEIPAPAGPGTQLELDGQARIGVTVAIEDPPGTVAGTLTGRVRLESVVQGLEARLLGSSARALFITTDGLIVDHPERNLVVAGERYPVESLDPERGRALQRGGTKVLAATAPTSALAGAVVIEWDEAEALAIAEREVRLTSILVATTIPLALAVVLVIAAQLLRPLDRLRRTLKRIGDGDLGARADEVGSAEFRDVAREVNTMASSLARHITDLERTQANLTAATTRFRAAFEQAPVPMVIGDSSARVTDANPAFCELLGHSRDELHGRTVVELTHPDHRAATSDAIETVLQEGSAGFELETSYRHADGREVPTLTSVAYVRETRRDLDYFIAHMIDLSELREAEDRFRHIVDSSPDVSLVVNGAGQVEMASRRVSEMFGHAVGDVIGQPVEMFVPERLRVAHEDHRSRFTSDTVREMGSGAELYGRRSDGSEFPVEIALSPIWLGGDQKTLATVRDVTERRRGEVAARKLAEVHAQQRQAIEINDNIVQGLTVARWSFDLGEIETARASVERTVETARMLVDRMLSAAGEIEPGMLRREHPALEER